VRRTGALAGGALAAWLLGSCTLTASLDDLKSNQSSRCATNVDCSGCVDCTTQCGCLAVSDLAGCVATCQAAGGGSGGGGTGGTGGTVPTGGTSGGGSAGLGGNPSQPGQVWCGKPVPCALSAQACCYALAGRALAPSCIANTLSCTGVRLECDGSEDCASGVCCLSIDSGSKGQSHCKASCDAGEQQLCGNQPSQCKSGLVCQVEPKLTAFNSCQ